MIISDNIVRNDEKAIFNLRALYSKYGYTPFRVSRFEEYELYASNRAFLPAGDIVAFTGAGGKLTALRPDVTLSIVKSIIGSKDTNKLYYNENIYRTVDGELKEQMQVGLECIGDIGIKQAAEVLLLAKQSLDILGEATQLDISHMGFLSGLLKDSGMTSGQRKAVTRCIGEKNIPALKQLYKNGQLNDDLYGKIKTLASLYGSFSEIKNDLEQISINDETDAALYNLEQLNDTLRSSGITVGINIDFSVVNDITYYNGIVFQGFINGVPEKVIAGGSYDELLHKFGKGGGAIGFAVYMDLVSQLKQTKQNDLSNTGKMLCIALPKGRLGEDAYNLFRRAGYECPGMNDMNRKLVLEDIKRGLRYLWVKPSDVAVYVERGVADIGVAGKDTLLESGRDVFELLDLTLGKCRMCVAAKKGTNHDCHDKVLRVATKYPNIAREYYRGLGSDIDIIHLHGSVELAPLIGLSDVIVDLVETGTTLEENGMEPVETIIDISARLISNKASYKFNLSAISSICTNITKVNEVCDDKDY